MIFVLWLSSIAARVHLLPYIKGRIKCWKLGENSRRFRNFAFPVSYRSVSYLRSVNVVVVSWWQMSAPWTMATAASLLSVWMCPAATSVHAWRGSTEMDSLVRHAEVRVVIDWF